jgi:hypothetical protein
MVVCDLCDNLACQRTHWYKVVRRLSVAARVKDAHVDVACTCAPQPLSAKAGEEVPFSMRLWIRQQLLRPLETA